VTFHNAERHRFCLFFNMATMIFSASLKLLVNTAHVSHEAVAEMPGQSAKEKEQRRRYALALWH